MVVEDALKIKNLPKQLSNAEKEEFLRHFGATNIKLITSQYRSKCVAFAKFESKEVAKAVLFRLHQLNVLNSRLSVEYAEHDIGHGKPNLKTTENLEKNNKKQYKTFINKITAWNNAVSFNQPPPGHLKYVYPKANRATINNIAHALASVPKFYTQVLHLMNRMNLPPPFSNVPDPPQMSSRPSSVPIPIQKPTESIENMEESEESELESDPDDGNKLKDIIPMKRKMPQKKAIKRPKFIKSNQNTAISKSKNPAEDIDNVFEKSTIQQQKRIELKVTSDHLEENAPDQLDTIDDNEDDNTEQQRNTVITYEELEHNRIPLKDLGVLPVFKDYHPGIPSTKLYIKNIAKTVEKNHLEYIYKRYLETDAEKSLFDIKLMQEGRMKGQAFVTLDNVQAAQKAVKETNGFILKDKPLVVVYAKSISKK